MALRMLESKVEGPKAWQRTTLRQDDWFMRIPDDAMSELHGVAAQWRNSRAPIASLTPAQFLLKACRVLMDKVRAQLADGAGFVVLDRLPMEDISTDEAIAMYWILASLIARPVAQKIDGTLVYDVQDTGLKPLPGSGVRPDKTNVEQNFHNDNAYSRLQPDYVGLLCVNPAPQGGESSVLNIATIHNIMLAEYRDLLSRLYGAFWIDRQKEHGPQDAPLLHEPVFAYDGTRLKVRMGIHTILNGYAVRGEPLDEPGLKAIAALKEVFGRESLSHRFTMERGQMEFVNNLETCHRRTAFVDGNDPVRKRRMVRLWLRDGHGSQYDG